MTFNSHMSFQNSETKCQISVLRCSSLRNKTLRTFINKGLTFTLVNRPNPPSRQAVSIFLSFFVFFFLDIFQSTMFCCIQWLEFSQKSPQISTSLKSNYVEVITSMLKSITGFRKRHLQAGSVDTRRLIDCKI